MADAEKFVMRPDFVKSRVAEIRRAKNDAEHAHGLEDELYEDVLRAIARGACEDVAACCKAALATKRMKFPRWTA